MACLICKLYSKWLARENEDYICWENPFTCLGLGNEWYRTEFAKTSDLCVLAKSALAQLSGNFEPRFAPKCSPRIVLSAHTNYSIARFAQRWFSRNWNRPTFWAVLPFSPLAKSPKMADLGVLAKSALAQLRGNFRSRALRQNAFQELHFKRILIIL